jgi:predicted aspartyl protease
MASALAMAHRFVAKGRRKVTDMAMPTEVRERFEREKEAYWQQRDELLRQYRGKWVAIVNGQVVAVGDSARAVIWEAFRKTGSTVGYVACVGDEERTYAIRQAVTGHFDESHEHPIPKVTATVGHMTGNLTTDVSFILDTGADITVLQTIVADRLGLWDSSWRTAFIRGIGSPPQQRQLYAAIVHIAGHSILVEVDCRDDIAENILGRDVLNEFAVFLCAKRRQVQLEWVEG